MHIMLTKRYNTEIKLVENIFLWQQNAAEFMVKVKSFQEDALQAYATLLAYDSLSAGFSLDLPKFSSVDLFEMTKNHLDSLTDKPVLCKYLIDIFEMQLFAACNEDSNDDTFQKNCIKYLSEAQSKQHENAISLYLQLFSRYNAMKSDGFLLDLHKMIAETLHGSLPNVKVFAEALHLLDNALTYQQESGNHDIVQECLGSLWHNGCPAQKNRRCNDCYAIVVHFIGVFLNECDVSSEFCNQFLNDTLWQFIRDGIESSELIQRKQSIYILKSVLQSSSGKAILMNSEQAEENIEPIWDSYFVVLENLLDNQSHLIVSSLEQYLSNIIKNLPPFWWSSIFVLTLNHHINSVIYYGVNFILQHMLCFNERTNIKKLLFLTLNNMYFYGEVNLSRLQLAQFIKSDINQSLDILNEIQWKAVPAWSLLKAIEMCLNFDEVKNEVSADNLVKFANICIKATQNKDELTLTSTILNILRLVTFSLDQLLNLYDGIKCTDIFHLAPEPLTEDLFEFIRSTYYNYETKIDYFNFVKPKAADQLAVLNEFFAKYEESIDECTDYEFLLIYSLHLEHKLNDALVIFKPRLYNLLKHDLHPPTVESVLQAACLLQFIVLRLMKSDEMLPIFTTIKGILRHLSEIQRHRMYKVHNMAKEMLILKSINLIRAKLTACPDIYPNRMEVLAILSDAILYEECEFDLNRFSSDNLDDVKLGQNLFNWFLSESMDTIKASYSGRVLIKILSKFPSIKCDIQSIFEILLSGKCQIECIFQLTHSASVERMEEILVDALLYGPELKADEKYEYDFIASISSTPTYNQMIRLTAMHTISNSTSLKMNLLKDLLFAKNEEIHRPRYFNNSYQHSLKLRYVQALAFLFRLHPNWDERLLTTILVEANQTNVTYVIEMIIGETITVEQFFQILKQIDGNKGLTSMFAIMYYMCGKRADDLALASRCIQLLIKYIFSKHVTVRIGAQITFLKLCESFKLQTQFGLIYNDLKHFMEQSAMAKTTRWSYESDMRFKHINCKHLLHSIYILREIPRLTEMHSDEYYKTKIYDASDDGLSIPMETSKNEEVVETCLIDSYVDLVRPITIGNVQKKLVPFREIFINKQLLNGLTPELQKEKQNSKSELIILASLLSKVPNLGGLSRSCEVFGVHTLALSNMLTIKRSEFMSLSMASEKWLNFIEIKPYYLISYLMAMKSNGYCIVGAEQTASGTMLHKTPLPKKMILVLGHEKDGIPANIVNLLDMAIEIPQFGVVRSLNVHVSAAIFMWEYCKQHLISSDTPNVSM